MRKDSILQQYYYKKLPKFQNAGQYGLVNARDLAQPAASESTSTIGNTPSGPRTTATTGMSKEQMAATSQAMGKYRQILKEKEKQRAAERRVASDTRANNTAFTLPTGETKKYDDMNWREKFYVSGKNLENMFRTNKNKETFFDEYLNPFSFIGSMAGNLAEAPYTAQQSGSNMPYLTAIGTPLLAGALGFDPLGSAIKKGVKIAEHPLVSTIPSVIRHKQFGPYGEALFFGAANKVAPLVANTPGLNLLYKKAAERVGEQSAGAFRNLSNIKNIFKKVSQPYNGTTNYLSERNLLRNYIYGDTRGFITSDVPTTGLEKYTNKYGPLKTFQLDVSKIENQPLTFESLLKNEDQISFINALREKGLVSEDALPNEQTFDALKNYLKNVGDIKYGANEYNQGIDDIAGHMKFLRHDPASDNIMIKTQDIWKFAPEDYLKRYHPGWYRKLNDNPLSLKNYLSGYSKTKQAGLMEKAGKPFVLIDERPFLKGSESIKDKLNLDKSTTLKLSPDDYEAALKELSVTDFPLYKEFEPKAKPINRKEQGGIIKDNRGQWAHPGKITEIGSNQITMQGVPYPVLGISNTGHTQMMYPEQEYKFKGKKVTEYPMMQKGGRAPIYTSNPNDPRLRAYNDSLNLYNQTLRILTPHFQTTRSAIDAYNSIMEEDKDYQKYFQKYLRSLPLEKRKKAQRDNDVQINYPNLFRSRTIKGIAPFTWKGLMGVNDLDPATFNQSYAIYKKPVQPVEYRPERLKFEKQIKDRKPSLKLIEPNLPEVKERPIPNLPYRVDYWDPSVGKTHQYFPSVTEGSEFMNELLKRPEGIGPYASGVGMEGYYETPPKKRNGGWLDKYQPGGERDEDYSRMQGFYNDLYEAGNKYANKTTGVVSPFNATRAVLKATLKHPEVLFMKRHSLKDPDSNPYGVESYTTEDFSGKKHPWIPTDWAEPRKDVDGGIRAILDRIKQNSENKKLDRQIRRGIKKQGECWGANCYEEINQAEYGGPLVDYYKGKMTGPNMFANGGAVSLNAIIKQNREDRDNGFYSGKISKYQIGGEQQSKLNPYTGYSVVDFLKAQNKPSDYESRKALASTLDIGDYRGRAKQNIDLINLIKKNPSALENYGVPSIEQPAEEQKVLQQRSITPFDQVIGSQTSPSLSIKQYTGDYAPSYGEPTPELPMGELAKQSMTPFDYSKKLIAPGIPSIKSYSQDRTGISSAPIQQPDYPIIPNYTPIAQREVGELPSVKESTMTRPVMEDVIKDLPTAPPKQVIKEPIKRASISSEKIAIPKYVHSPSTMDEILARQAFKESGFNTKVVQNGYQGIAQIGPIALKEYRRLTGDVKANPLNANDAVKIQKYLMNNLYNLKSIAGTSKSDAVRMAKTLAAYNYGIGNVNKFLEKQKALGIDVEGSLDWVNNLNKETRDYIKFVLLKQNVNKYVTEDEYKRALSNPKNKIVQQLYNIKGFEEGGQSNQGYYNYNYGVPEFKWGGPTYMNKFGYLVDKKAGGGEFHHGYYDQFGGDISIPKLPDLQGPLLQYYYSKGGKK